MSFSEDSGGSEEATKPFQDVSEVDDNSCGNYI